MHRNSLQYTKRDFFFSSFLTSNGNWTPNEINDVYTEMYLDVSFQPCTGYEYLIRITYRAS